VSELPKGWINTTLGEVTSKPQYGWTTKSTNQGELHLLRTTDITSGVINWHKVPYCDKIPDPISKYIVHDRDILISRAGSVGFSILIKSPKPAVFASYLIRFIPNIDAKFVSYFLNSPDYWKSILENKLGIAVPNVNATKLSNIKIPLPPLPEQKRIVAKIEELFTKLDAGVAALQKAKALLKQYRQSVLKAAVEGRLTEEWRKEHANEIEPASVLLERIQEERKKRLGKKYKPPKPVDTSNLPELPEGWVWARADLISTKITDGEHLRPNMVQEGIAFISAKDVRDHGVVFKETLFVSKEDANKFRKRCNPERNDVLVVSRGATVGRSCIVNTDRIFCLLGSVILIKPHSDIVSKYLSISIKSPSIQKDLIELSGSTAQQAIYIRDIRNQLIPIPPKDEQVAIVKEVERLTSIIDESEQIIDAELKRSQSLRQSILKQAFEGKLVSQDPNDLPAPRPDRYYVYVLECSNGSHYIGQTQNIEKRWIEHIHGKGAEWTKKYPPVKLVHWEEFDTRKEAVKREKYLKTGFGRKWLKREIKAGRTRQAGEPASVLLERIKAEKI